MSVMQGPAFKRQMCQLDESDEDLPVTLAPYFDTGRRNNCKLVKLLKLLTAASVAELLKSKSRVTKDFKIVALCRTVSWTPLHCIRDWKL